MKTNLISGLLFAYVATIVGVSAVGGTKLLNKTCAKVDCNGGETIGQNYQRFIERTNSTYSNL